MFQREEHRVVLRVLRALDALLGDPGFQNRCLTGLSVSAPEEVLDGAGLLLSDLEGG